MQLFGEYTTTYKVREVADNIHDNSWPFLLITKQNN